MQLCDLLKLQNHLLGANSWNLSPKMAKTQFTAPVLVGLDSLMKKSC